jgi:uncharacterized protein
MSQSWFQRYKAALKQKGNKVPVDDPKIQLVKRLYEAFTRGDVQYILANLTDDVSWGTEVADPTEPWHGTFTGKEAVGRFFAAVSEGLEVTEFTPLAFAANEAEVFAVVHFGMRSKETGREATVNLHHWWRFSDYKVSFYRGSEDSALTHKIMTPIDPPT